MTKTENHSAEKRTKIPASLLITFAVLSISGGLGNCSQTAVNALLTGMSAEMGVSVATSQWLTSGYILALGVFVPLAPFLSKRFSERFMMMVALGCIAAGSLLVIAAPLFPVALLARVMQAAGAGLMMPAMQTMVMVDMPHERMGLFMGINGIAMGFMVNLGPTIGGALESAFGWKSFFWFIFACMVIMMIPTMKYARSQGGNKQERFDSPSFIICGFGFVGLLLGFSNASNLGVTHVAVWLPIIVGSLLIVLFVRREKRMVSPLISMDIFADRQYCWGFIGSCVLSAAFVGVMLVIPLYVEELRGGTALDAGIVLLPASLVALVANVGAGALMDKFGARKVLIATTTFLVVGAVLALFCDDETPLWFLAMSQAIRAAGISGSIGPFIGWSLEKLPRPIVSDGSSFLTVGRQACASLGTAAMVLLIVTFSQMGQVVFAYHAAFFFSVVFSVLTFLVAVLKVRS